LTWRRPARTSSLAAAERGVELDLVCSAMSCVCVAGRQKLGGGREEVIEEQQAQVLEDVPLRAVTAVTHARLHHNQPLHFKYILHIAHYISHA